MPNETAVGVIVARFQSHVLHKGHREFLHYVISKGHNLNVIVLGKTKLGIPTFLNPLDIDSRMRMIQEEYPDRFTVIWLEDVPHDNQQWSNNLDKLIGDIANGRDVVLYGSRDSFTSCYKGQYKVETYNQTTYCSATAVREQCGKVVHGSPAWRAGVIWAMQHQYPHAYPTIDVALFDKSKKNIYLAKKSSYDKLMFIGGFVDPTDRDYEHTACREVKEETNLDIAPNKLHYIGSYRVEDSRYMFERDKIITTFFIGVASDGTPRASDDIVELHCRRFAHLTHNDLVSTHHYLFDKLNEWMKTHKF